MIDNVIIEDEEKKFYFRCNQTNSKWTECEVCQDGYVLNEKGLCVDDEHCVKKDDDGNCIKCKNKDGDYFCLNKDFECVEIYYNNHCLQCNYVLDFEKCNKYFDGYTLDENGECQKKRIRRRR